MSNKTIYFRADGDKYIGLGHIYRSLALYKILQRHFSCVFVTKLSSEEILNNIKEVCKKIIVLNNRNEEITFLSNLNQESIIILDGYGFNFEYRANINPSVFKKVLIDDEALDYYGIDLIINHCASKNEILYPSVKKSKLLLGFKYALIREEFRQKLLRKTVISIETIFICMGGSDINNLTLKCLSSLEEFDFIKKINIVVGAAYSELEFLKQYITSRFLNKEILIYQNVSSKKVQSLISSSHLAFSSASSIAMEVCCSRIPLIVGITAPNQIILHSNLVSSNCCLTIGDWANISIDEVKNSVKKILDPDLIRLIIRSQKVAFDNKFDSRLLEKFIKLAN